MMTDPIRGILGPGETAGILSPGGAKTGQAAGGAASAGGAAAADSANVSQTQSLLETINATVAAVPTVNQNQVAALRHAIANGSYQINPQQVAKQILSSEQALIAPGAGSE
jgi:negative regulator of flagellin synthesis FlgM